ncbi:MAG: hypothetical protein ACI8V2_003257 [Candidatus Latescibacterota bacterium]|jgi:hypothetical protein
MIPIPVRTESLDLVAALRRHGTAQEFKQQAQKILRTSQAHLAMMRLAIETDDAQNLERFASLLVNTFTLLSPPAALDLSLMLERQGRAKQLTDASQTIKLLDIEFNRLQTTIANL